MNLMHPALPAATLAALLLTPAAPAECTATEQQKLVATDAVEGDGFGRAAAMSGDVLVVGAEWNDDHAWSAGAAYVFRAAPDGSAWTQEQKLVASNPGPSDLFGYAVAADGDRVVIGAYLNGVSGAAYVFEFDGETWTETAVLRPWDDTDNNNFGFGVAVSGDVILVGASVDSDAAPNAGAAYVFRLDGTTWSGEAKFTSPEAESWDRYGGSVDLDGDLAVIGCYRDNDEGTNAGAAYIHRFEAGAWTPSVKITASNAAAGDYFGQSVAVSGGTIVVGAQYSTDLLGAAYVFEMVDGAWSERSHLVASDASQNDIFGFDVDIDGDTIVVGAHSDDDRGLNSGSAYLFRRDGAAWEESAKLGGSETETLDSLGWSVAISGPHVAAGAYRDDDACPEEPECNSGAAYVFSAAPCGCVADVDGDGIAGFDDLLAVLAAWGPCAGCPADVDASGAVGFDDLLAVLAAWGPCPG
jgi:hypothetical protein